LASEFFLNRFFGGKLFQFILEKQIQKTKIKIFSISLSKNSENLTGISNKLNDNK
jgi:hypothetical protein